jgi:hypothetical protein
MAGKSGADSWSGTTSSTEAPRAEAPKSDPVSRPSHYVAGAVECIDALESATAGLDGVEAFCAGNAIKYIWRHNRKNGNEDLMKAKWYIDRLIQARNARLK